MCGGEFFIYEYLLQLGLSLGQRIIPGVSRTKTRLAYQCSCEEIGCGFFPGRRRVSGNGFECFARIVKACRIKLCSGNLVIAIGSRKCILRSGQTCRYMLTFGTVSENLILAFDPGADIGAVGTV